MADDTTEMDPTVHRIAGELAKDFEGTFSAETVLSYVREAFQTVPRGSIADFRPALASRFARERLRAAAQAEGLIAKDRPEVLFVCVHNAGRSQMAAALLATLSDGRVSVRSAGSQPANEVNPGVVEAMAEASIDLSNEFAKPLTDEVVRAADVVITMGCGDACPVYPGKRYRDWVVDDPAGKSVEEIRPIRADIERRVRALIDELGIPVSAPSPSLGETK